LREAQGKPVGHKGLEGREAVRTRMRPDGTPGKPGFFARPRAKKCAKMINIDRKKVSAAALTKRNAVLP
jgi:hypothetical protein